MSQNRRTDPGTIMQRRFDDEAAVDKVSQVGLCWQPIGAIDTKKRVEPKTPVMVWNNSGAVAYIKFAAKDTDATAPIGPTDGVPVLPNEKFAISSGDNHYIIGSAATLFAFVANND